MQRRSTSRRNWGIVALVTLTGSCGDDGYGPADDADGGYYCGCNYDELCIDGTCAPMCETSADCAAGAGQYCVPDDDLGYCACAADLCGDRQDCSSEVGRCVPVECSERVPCERTSDYCDVEGRRCYPLSGDCSVQKCQPTPESVSDIASVTCGANDLCEVQRVSAAPDFADPRFSAPLEVLEPDPGDRVPEGDPVEFRWQELSEAALLLVYGEQPVSPEQFKSGAIWGAAVPAGARPRVQWQAGHPIQNGKWRDATPALPDPGVYYLLMQALEGDEVMRSSPLIPFLVGDMKAPWPAPNQPCDKRGVAEQCLHPSNPMVCDGSRCRQLCGSEQDCPGGRTCEPPDGELLVRMCSR